MKTKIEIIPAILPRDFVELEDGIAMIKGFVKRVQVDICDGQFVHNATWPYRKHDDSFENILHEDAGLPSWQELDYEFDLMVNKPEEVVDEWVSVGATRIIIHAEAKGDVAKAIEMLKDRVEVGLALNMDTPIESIHDAKFGVDQGNIQFIQLMGIDNVGFQHQAFDEKVIGRVKYVRLKHPGMPISVDGGVSLETAAELIAAGADRLVVGSAIFDAENPVDAIQAFKALVK